MHPRFDSLDDGTGLEIVDPIENRRFVLYTPTAVTPAQASTDGFAFPVTTACEVVTSGFSLPHAVVFNVRDDADASQIAEVYEGTREFDDGEYLLELDAPMKLYVRYEGAFKVEATGDDVRVSFGGDASVQVGARSFHTSPAETLTVPDDPAAAMDAISTFGSALKTTSCERSWPTLRGHPPRVERGDELSIPADLEPPDTGVTLRVPEDYEHVYAVAPLAYYLGADVVADDAPRLTTDRGFERSLDTDRGFEDEVVRTLKRVFRMDCIVRTEGHYRIPLHARERLEASSVDLDVAALYDRPLAEQLEAYFSVPYSALDGTKTWNRVTYVRPDPESVEYLPFVVDDLSLVRVRTPERESARPSGSRSERDALASFKRQSEAGGVEAPAGESEASGRDDGRYGVPRSGGYVPLPDDDTVERAWVGDGAPVHGTKLLKAAFDHDPTSTDGVVDVTVVCNDDRMREEWDAVSGVYGSREVTAFDVECRFDVTTDELRDLLAGDTDLFHYVGHIDGRGFECSDGVFDAGTLDRTGATTVLLNACRSYGQGRALVERGARAAIVSVADVDNLAAVSVGELVARLLNYGFGVASALEVVEEYTGIGRQYLALGDPSVTVAQCEDGAPIVCELSCDSASGLTPEDDISFTVRTYENDGMTMGSISRPHVQGGSDSTYYLPPGVLDTFDVTVERFERAVGDPAIPFVVDGELTWSDEWFSEIRGE